MTTPPTPNPPLSSKSKAGLIFVIVAFAFVLLMVYISRDPAVPGTQPSQAFVVPTPPASIATNQLAPTPHKAVLDSDPVLEIEKEHKKWQASLEKKYSEKERKSMYFDMSHIIYAATDEADAKCGSDRACWKKENDNITDRMEAAFNRKYKISSEESKALAVEGMGKRWPNKGRNGQAINLSPAEEVGD